MSGRVVRVAHAHSGDQSYLYLYITGTSLTGRVHLPVDDLERAVGETLPEVEAKRAPIEGPIRSHIESYLTNRISISDGAETMTVSYGKAIQRSLSSGRYVFVDFEVPGYEFLRPGQLEVRYEALLESNPHHEALLITMESRGWGRLIRYQEERVELSTSKLVAVRHFRRPTSRENLYTSISQGFRLVVGKAKQVTRRLSGSSA